MLYKIGNINMRKKIKLEDILDKYVIVVLGNEKKIVYDVDDSRIFSVHITGCGRGARNASISHSTFKTIEQAKKGIKYLDTCHWTDVFTCLKVSDLRDNFKIGWAYLIQDIANFNDHIDFEEKMERDERMKHAKEAVERHREATRLLACSLVESICENEYGETVITLYKK
jgi:hypothetical protein